MESKYLERIRNPNFPVARRGYERREVDNFLLSLADWLEQGGTAEAESYAVTRKLERAGETTARVLATAQAEADQILKEADAEARKRIGEAQEAAHRRAEAAKTQARAIVDEAERRRAELEDVIGGLTAQRNEVVQEVTRLRDTLANALAEQRIATQRPAGKAQPAAAKKAPRGPELADAPTPAQQAADA